ncbi:MAG TPA: Hsp70 family protein, partial [Polyangia bacterium]
KMLYDSYEYAEQDLKQRQLVEARVEADRILAALKQALAVDGRLLSPDDRAEIDASIARLETAMRGDDHAHIRLRTSQLDFQTKPFAEKRMNAGIARAIGGHQVDEIAEKVEHAKGTAEHEGLAPDHGGGR